MIEICVVVYNFQRRWMWQLSSLLQQTGSVNFIINVAYVRNNGKPSTEEIMAFYRKTGLVFVETAFEDDLSLPKSRGTIRNYQIKNSSGKWIFFADCDVVYSSDFLSKLQCHLLPQFKGIISASKFLFTDLEATEKAVSTDYPVVIENAYERATQLPVFRVYDRHVAAGGMQVIQRESILKFGDGKYVGRNHGDKELGNIGTVSDIWFRKGIQKNSGEAPKMLDLPVQIHLNHQRNINPDKSINPDYDIRHQR